jgi:hypothetical protein
MKFHLQILIIIFIVFIYSIIIPHAFSIENQTNSLFYQQQNCSDGSCTSTTCYNDKPCKTIMKSNNETSVDTGSSELPAAAGFIPW